MPASKLDRESGSLPRNRKVMVHVAPNVHRAMEHLATDEDRPTSSLYVEAALAFLKARGKQVDADPMPIAPPHASAVPELAMAIERQGERIEELHAEVAVIRGAGLCSGQGPAGTKAAEAMKVMLGILKAAGAAGMAGRELDAAAYEAGVKSGAVETAPSNPGIKHLGAGIVWCEGKRWRLDNA